MTTLSTRVVASGLGFPEGPVVLPDGSVLVAEMARGRVSRVLSDGSVELVAECGGCPNGLALDRDGAILVANAGETVWETRHGVLVPGAAARNYTGGSIQRIDATTRHVDVLFDSYEGRKLSAPNDLVADSHGGFFFTDHGKTVGTGLEKGALYYASSKRKLVRIADLTTPNGVGLSPAGDQLYVAETRTGRVWRWTLTGPGVVAKASSPFMPTDAQLVATLGDYRLCDSMALEASGALCVAALVNVAVAVINPDTGSVAYEFIETSDYFVTNLAFGGSDGFTAFVTSSGLGELLEVAWPRPGHVGDRDSARKTLDSLELSGGRRND